MTSQVKVRFGMDRAAELHIQVFVCFCAPLLKTKEVFYRKEYPGHFE